MHTVTQNAVLLGLFCRGLDLFGRGLVHRLLPFLIPFANRDQMVLQTRDWITQRPFITLLRAAITGRIIRG